MQQGATKKNGAAWLTVGRNAARTTKEKYRRDDDDAVYTDQQSDAEQRELHSWFGSAFCQWLTRRQLSEAEMVLQERREADLTTRSLVDAKVMTEFGSKERNAEVEQLQKWDCVVLQKQR